MNTPSHDVVSHRAQEIWQSYGRPVGRDTEIWLEAERQLAAGASDPSHDSASRGSARPGTSSRNAATSPGRLTSETAEESMIENHISPAIPEQEAIKAALQKKEARAPITPKKGAPKVTPPESGKPLWDKPHSS